MTLEQEFALLMASISRGHNAPFPRNTSPKAPVKLTQTRTVYSVGEALQQKELSRNAKLGGSARRNSSS